MVQGVWTATAGAERREWASKGKRDFLKSFGISGVCWMSGQKVGAVYRDGLTPRVSSLW